MVPLVLYERGDEKDIFDDQGCWTSSLGEAVAPTTIDIMSARVGFHVREGREGIPAGRPLPSTAVELPPLPLLPYAVMKG